MVRKEPATQQTNQIFTAVAPEVAQAAADNASSAGTERGSSGPIPHIDWGVGQWSTATRSRLRSAPGPSTGPSTTTASPSATTDGNAQR